MTRLTIMDGVRLGVGIGLAWMVLIPVGVFVTFMFFGTLLTALLR